MPHSLARLHVHLVFSTKRRAPSLHDGIREALHRYISGVLTKRGCRPTLINSVDDHVHALFELGRTVSLSEIVEAVKKSSSKWIKTQGAEFAAFSWQPGYGAFSVSESNVGRVRRYVADQREHHRKRSFEEEYRVILERHGIEFDERRLWD